MDMASISAALASLNVAGGIAKGLLDLKLGADMQAKVFQLQSEILTAQDSALTARSQLTELQAEVDRLRSWEAERARYGLMK